MGIRGSVIDLTVILLLHAQLTESATTRDANVKYSTDDRNDVNDKTVIPATNNRTRPLCKDIIEKKEGATFFAPIAGDTFKGTAVECVQWCLEKITCVHVRHYGGECVWTDVPKKLHRAVPGYTTYTVRYRCPKYHKCSDEVCRNNAICMPLFIGRDVGIQCVCHESCSGWFCERQHCYEEMCENGGTCHNTSTGFSCTCPPFTTGVVCETETPALIEGSPHNRLALIVGSTFVVVAICGVCIVTAIVAATVAANTTKEIK